MKKLLGYFFQGLLYTVPLAVTIYILIQLFQLVDGLLQTYINKLLPFEIPGLGVLIILIIITLIGIIGSFLVTQPIKSFFEKLLERAPLFKVIYTSVKELLMAFVGKERKFNKPVIVRIGNDTNLEKLGFITQTDLQLIGLDGTKVAVYFPHSYAFSGEHYIVSSESVTPLDAHPADVMKFIISGGVTKFS